MVGSHIFLSYRRDDTAPYAIALKREFERNLRATDIFLDTHRIEVAAQWPVVIFEALKRANVVLVLIGPKWLDPDTESNRARLFDEDDWVTKEVGYALDNKMDNTVPILLGGAKPPTKSCLPAQLAGLCEKQTYSIEVKNWQHDVDKLCKFIATKYGFDQRGREFEFPVPGGGVKALTPPVSDERLRQALAVAEMSGWAIEGSDDADHPMRAYIKKKFHFKNFPMAMKFMNEVGKYSEKLDHHPRWENVHSEVLVRLSTWDAGHKVTEIDLMLAVHMNRVERQLMKID